MFDTRKIEVKPYFTQTTSVCALGLKYVFNIVIVRQNAWLSPYHSFVSFNGGADDFIAKLMSRLILLFQ